MSTGPAIPHSALLRVGVTEPPGSPRTLVRSYRTVSPLPVRAGEPAHAIGGLLSVALNRQVAQSWLSPAPCPVESRLSSTPPTEVAGAAATQPAHRHGECSGTSLNDRRTGTPLRAPIRVIEPGVTNERQA